METKEKKLVFIPQPGGMNVFLKNKNSNVLMKEIAVIARDRSIRLHETIPDDLTHEIRNFAFSANMKYQEEDLLIQPFSDYFREQLNIVSHGDFAIKTNHFDLFSAYPFTPAWGIVDINNPVKEIYEKLHKKCNSLYLVCNHNGFNGICFCKKYLCSLTINFDEITVFFYFNQKSFDEALDNHFNITIA